MEATFPAELRYTNSDEWVRREGDDVTSGITAFAAEQLGDIVYLQLPDVGRQVTKGESYGEIESVKAVSELYAALSGEIIAVNDELDQNPALINEDPYERGWILKVRLDKPEEYDSLLDATGYEKSTTERH